MQRGLLIRLQPNGPWRFGSTSGSRTETDYLYHSDSLYSALTHAMGQIGQQEEWLAATARAAGEPAVRFGSCYPWMGETYYVRPPLHLWPAASPKLRTEGASFLPVTAVRALLAGEDLDEDAWTVDPYSRCLLPSAGEFRRGPFRPSVRTGAAMDRLVPGAHEAHRQACVEFAEGAGLWTWAAFSEDGAQARWSQPLQAVFRLLADSGFGGGRSKGWGRSQPPKFTEGSLLDLVLPVPVPAAPTAPAVASVSPAGEPESRPEVEAGNGTTETATETGYWLLSLYRPATSDQVNWERGDYTMLTRGGRVESPAASGDQKRQLRMVAEGSVLMAGQPPVGSAADVAPSGFPHPVYRYGFPVSVPVPVRTTR